MAGSNEKRNRSKSKRNARRRLTAGSFLLSRTAELSSRCSGSFGYGIASRVLCSAQRVENAFRTGIGARILQKIGFRETVSGPIRKAVATGACGSRLFAWAEKLRHAFFHTKARFFGVALLVFSLYSAGIFFAKEFMGWGFGASSPTDLCFCAAVLSAALPLLFCRNPLNVFFSESRLFSRIFIGTLGIDPAAFRQGGDRVTSRGGLAFVVGTALGIATLFFRPHAVLLTSLAVLVCFCIPAVPEMGLLAAVIVLPFASLRLTAFLTALALFGYAQKTLRLKRAFRFGATEMFLLLTVGASALSAATTGDVFFLKRMLLFSCIWFLAVNLITTERLFRKYMAALLYGGLLTLFFTAVGQLTAGLQWEIALPAGMNGTVLKCYLLMMTPIALLHSKRRSGFVLLLLIALNAYLTHSVWICIGLLGAVLAYAAFSHGAWFGSALTGGLAVPAAAVLFGDRFGALGSGFSETARALAGKYFLSGVGSGDGALLAASLAEGLRPDGFASGLYTRLTLDGGLILVLLFVGTAFLALQRAFTCMRAVREEKKKAVLCGGIVASAVLFLLAGAFTDAWSDLRVLGVFWCICPAASLTGDLYGMEQEKEIGRQWI